MKAEKKAVLDIIQPWYQQVKKNSKSENERKQKQKELIELGCFIHSFDDTIKIINGLRERPDFEVEWKNQKIGIELRDVIRDYQAKQKEGTLEIFFKEIAKELTAISCDFNGIYNVRFSKKLPNFNYKIKSKIKSEIINYIVKNEIPSPELIRSIDKSFHSGVFLYSSEPFIISGNLKRNTIEEAISKKNKLINKYANNEFDEVWLLLVLGGAEESSNYNKIEDAIFNKPFKTGFNRVLLFNFIDMKVYELKTNLI